MTRRFSRSAARSNALAMLVFWLLALGVGIAHGCLVHPAGAGHDATLRQAAPVAWLTDGHELRVQASDAQHHAPLPDEAACIEFCAGKQTVPVKQQADPPTQQPPALVWASVYSTAPATRLRGPAPSADGRAIWPRQPASILFLRLTL